MDIYYLQCSCQENTCEKLQGIEIYTPAVRSDIPHPINHAFVTVEEFGHRCLLNNRLKRSIIFTDSLQIDVDWAKTLWHSTHPTDDRGIPMFNPAWCTPTPSPAGASHGTLCLQHLATLANDLDNGGHAITLRPDRSKVIHSVWDFRNDQAAHICISITMVYSHR